MNDRRKESSLNGLPPAQGLYLPEYEHDACGVGFICHIKGKSSNKTVSDALMMLERMNHRGGCGCDPNSGDGAGILTKLPDKFLRREMKKQGITLPRAKGSTAWPKSFSQKMLWPGTSASKSSKTSSASTG